MTNSTIKKANRFTVSVSQILLIILSIFLLPACERVQSSVKSSHADTLPEPVATTQVGATVDGTSGATQQSLSLSISGHVRQPLTLSQSDIEQYQSIVARLNDVHKDESYHGVHEYRGVPLQTLLALAHVEKEESIFGRPIDLAIVVGNNQGEEVILSWGEVFYRNPADVLIAFAATPIVPHKSCSSCHQKEIYEDWLFQLSRNVGLPKLVVSKDQWSDRAIENVSRIEVRDMGRNVGVFLAKKDKPKKFFSQRLVIQTDDKEPFVITDLEGFERHRVSLAQAGDGTGFHGIRHYEGALLSDVLRKVSLEPDPQTAFVCSAHDGYRILLSSGEVFLGPAGGGVLLADSLNDQPIGEDGGRFKIIPLGDMSADRWLKSVSRIDVIRAVLEP